MFHNFEDREELMIKDFSFLPSIEMNTLSVSQKKNQVGGTQNFQPDIFDDENYMIDSEQAKINLQKLSKYIKFSLDIRDQEREKDK